jgi:hypothetical protein
VLRLTSSGEKSSLSTNHISWFSEDLRGNYCIIHSNIFFDDINVFAEDEQDNIWLGTNGHIQYC